MVYAKPRESINMQNHLLLLEGSGVYAYIQIF